MPEVLAVLTSLPTAVFTTVMLLCLVYWTFVILGALDLDFLGGAEGHADGAIEGAAKGAMQSVFDGAEAAVDAKSGVVGGHLEPDGDFAVSMIGLDSLRRVPVTISLSFFALLGLLTSGLVCLSIGPHGWLVDSGVFVGSSLVSLVATSFAVRPLGKLFATNKAVQKRDLIGKVAEVSTGQVNESFGQAVLEDGGASLILQIRDSQGSLVRGDKVLLVDLNDENGTYSVERLPPQFAGEGRRFLNDREREEPVSPEREADEKVRTVHKLD